MITSVLSFHVIDALKTNFLKEKFSVVVLERRYVLKWVIKVNALAVKTLDVILKE